MKKKDMLLIFIPLIISLIVAYFHLLIFLPVVVISVFIVVSMLSFTRKRENLWLFLLGTISFLPINLFIANEYPVLRIIIFMDTNIGLLNVFAAIEIVMLLTCIEALVMGYMGRMIWRRQYVLNLPEFPE